jgi:glycosyltransferase involved in cell wall biosynthesis/SAM-dependent methyltransferase
LERKRTHILQVSKRAEDSAKRLIHKRSVRRDVSIDRYLPGPVTTPVHAQPFIIQESRLAHKLLDGLTGIEIGAAAYNPFGLQTKNVDISEQLDPLQRHLVEEQQRRFCGVVTPIDISAWADELPLPDSSQDMVIHSNVWDHLPNPLAALGEWVRVVRPGGYIFAIVPRPESLGPHDHRTVTTLETHLMHYLGGSSAKDRSFEEDVTLYGTYSVFDEQSLAEIEHWFNFTHDQLLLKRLCYQERDDKSGAGRAIVWQVVKGDDGWKGLIGQGRSPISNAQRVLRQATSVLVTHGAGASLRYARQEAFKYRYLVSRRERRMVTHALNELLWRGPVGLARYMAKGLYNRQRIAVGAPEIWRVQEVRRKYGWLEACRFVQMHLTEHRYNRDLHAITFGYYDPARLAPERRPPNEAWRAPSPTPFRGRILFLTNYDFTGSKRYRVDNMIEQLRKLGVDTKMMWGVQALEKLNEVLSYDVIVFQRMTLDPAMQYLIDRAHEQGVALVYEIDDYLYEPEVILDHHSIRNAPPDHAQYYREYCPRVRQLMLACDYFIGTTRPLVTGAEALGLKSFLVRNGMNDVQLRLAAKALRKRAQRAPDDTIRIGYTPGTKTHEGDFAVAASAVARILHEFPNTRFVNVGILELPKLLIPYRDRVDDWGLVTWQELVDRTAWFDINIAPLELDDLFNDSKSALKYFEPALLSVPTIASPTDDFRLSITHDLNGYLATTEDEWYRCLHKLLTDPSKRHQMGQAAQRDALSHYTSVAQAPSTLATYRELLRDWRGRRERASRTKLVSGSNSIRGRIEPAAHLE